MASRVLWVQVAMKPKAPRPRDIITLDDLVPRLDIKGGAAKRVFGATGSAPKSGTASASAPAKTPARPARDRK